MKKGINVLSLFDGMSCGQIALNRERIKVENYFASEIDKHAISITKKNFPETKHLGSVVDVDGFSLPKIDLLIGGSPCQSFSFAGKKKGMSTKCETEILTLKHYLELKNNCFEFEGQSYLFWEFIRLLNETKPKYFLLENVEMGEKWEKVLSHAIGVNGIHINSALVSAQNRKRIYWTNIGMEPSGLFGYLETTIKRPKDKRILLKHILQNDVSEKYFLSDKMISSFQNHKERHKEKGTGFGFAPKNENEKGNSLRANAAICPTDNMLIVKNFNIDSDKLICKFGFYTCINCNEIFCNTCEDGDNYEENFNIDDVNYNNEIEKSLANEKATTIDSSYYKGFGVRNGACRQVVEQNVNNYKIRRLTPVECERLQTVPDNYTQGVSDSQRYKMLGNGWTVDVIKHFFSYLTFERF
jgi:DNA (cytosine-5)-methyltransferase 3A